MDKNSATYYRTILYNDGNQTKELPADLHSLHEWVASRQALLGLGGQISKATALQVVMLWIATTSSGQQLVANNPLLHHVWPADDDFDVDWSTVQNGTPVEIIGEGSAITAVFMHEAPRRKGFVVLQVDGTPRTYKTENVRLKS